MNIKLLQNLTNEQKEELKRELVFRPLESVEELQAWMYLFLDILFPIGVVYPTSTHAPSDAMWRIYELMKTGESANCPEAVMLSSRDSYKCQVKGSKLLTPNGLTNIENVKVGDTIWSGWNWRKVTNWIDDGVKDGIKLTLPNNTTLISTPIHRYWILRNGVEQWEEAGKLQPNDRICYNLKTPLANGFPIDKNLFYLGLRASKAFSLRTTSQPYYENNSMMLGFISGLFDEVGQHADNYTILKGLGHEVVSNIQAVLASWGVYAVANKTELFIGSNGISKLLKIGMISEKCLAKRQSTEEPTNQWLSFYSEKVSKAHFYDLTVEHDHSYWSNGCISHNTLAAAAIETLCLLHFRFSIAHAAAISSQSEKAIQYIDSFFRKLKPYLDFHGWKKVSDSKRKIEWITDEGEAIYLRVLIMTTKGMNSEHVPMLFLDEIDLVQDPRAMEEAKMVPSIYKGFYPLTVSLSTRKYKGGLMEKKIKEVQQAGGEIYRWNILDVTERIPRREAMVSKPKVTRYLRTSLPMENIPPEDWQKLPDEKKLEYEKFEAYQGVAEDPMLAVMKHYLVERPYSDVGDLYKPLIAVKNNFKITSPDMAEAQLLCNKPSSSGLVYPRFDEVKNVLSVNAALKKLMGEDCSIDSFEYLTDYLRSLGVRIFGGADWGFSDHTALVILALLPGGEVWHLDTLSLPGLELDDIMKYALEMQEIWGVEKWYVDQAYPAYIKTMKRKGLMVPKFKKVVADGIAALQGKIVDSNNIRKFYVIDTPRNHEIIEAFQEYRWQIDGKGDVIEGKPHHDAEGISDKMDALRYPFQNLFSKLSGVAFSSTVGDSVSEAKKAIESGGNRKEIVKQVNRAIITEKIGAMATNNQTTPQRSGKKRIFWG